MQIILVMTADESKKTQDAEMANWPQVNIGNASNPSPNDDSTDSSAGDQLLGKQAEKYIREVANIEDVPDASDQEAMDETINNTNDQ